MLTGGSIRGFILAFAVIDVMRLLRYGNNIAIDSSGITIDSKGDINIKATGNISIEGMNVNAKANAQFKAEGSAGAEVSSGAVSVIKGSVVQIN